MQFRYRARTAAGSIESDVIEASSRQAAVVELRARRLMPLEVSQRAGGFSLPRVISLFHRVSLLDKLTFIKNLALLVRSGISVPRGLKMLAGQTANRYFQGVIAQMGQAVESGSSLSESFARHPKIFSGIYVSLIEVGEASGNLDQNLGYLVSLVKRQDDLLRKTKGALTYPAVVIATLVLVGIVMFIFVLPKLTSTFTDLKVELPLPTRILIWFVDTFSHYAILIIPGLALTGIAAVYFLRAPTGRRLVDRVSISLPVVSGISQKINLARFTLTLGSLLRSGIAVVSALKIASKSLGNQFYEQAVLHSADRVRSGVSMSDAMREYPKLFPSLINQMMKVGEESGSVEDILKDIGDYYEEEVDQIMKNISSIIEPVLMVFIGAVVGVIAVALIMPIYSITQSF